MYVECEIVSNLICDARSQLSTDEQKAIVAGLSNPDHVQATGIRADGKKFLTIRAEPERIYGKKQVRGAYSNLFCPPAADIWCVVDRRMASS